MIPLRRKQHSQAAQGSYFTTNNAQTGIATTAAATWATTTPTCLIANTDVAGGSSIYVDYIKLVATAAGSWASAGVNLQLMIYTDTGNRYSSGGTNLTANIVSPNSGSSKASIANVYFGAITAASAVAQKAVVGLDILRPAVSATVAGVVGDKILMNFGGVEAMINGSITVANASNLPIALPPLIIAPATCALIYYVMNGTTPSAASYAPEICWWEEN